MEISQEVLMKPTLQQPSPFVILRNHCTTPFTIVRAKHQGPIQKKLYKENKYNAHCCKDEKQSAKPNQMIFRKLKGIHKNQRKTPHFFSPKKLLHQKLYSNRLVQSDYEYCSGSSQGQISNFDHSLHSSADYMAVFSTQEFSNTKYFRSPFYQLDAYQKSFSQKSSPQMSCNQLDFCQNETKDFMTHQEGVNTSVNSCPKKSIFSHYKDPNTNLNQNAFLFQNSQNNNNCDSLQQPQNSVISQQPTLNEHYSFTQKVSQFSQQEQSNSNIHCLDKVADQIQKLNLNLQSHNTSPSNQTQTQEMQSISLFNNNNANNSKSHQQLTQNQISNSELPKAIEQQILSLNMNNLQEIMLYNQKIKEKQIQEEYIKKQLYLVQQQQMVEEKYQQEMQNQKIEQEISKQKLESLKEQQKLQQQLHVQMILQERQQQAIQLQKQQLLQQKLLQQQQQQQMQQNLQQKISQEQKTNQQIQLQMVQLINNLKAKGVQVTQEQLIVLVKNHSLKMQQQQQLQQQQQQLFQSQQQQQQPSQEIQRQNVMMNQTQQQTLGVIQNNFQQQIVQQQIQIQEQHQSQQPKRQSSLEYVEDHQEFSNNAINDEQEIFIQNYSKNMDEEFLELSNNQNSYGSNNLNNISNNNNDVNNNNDQFDFEMMLDDLIQLKSPTKVYNYSPITKKSPSPLRLANNNSQLEISQKIESPLKKHQYPLQNAYDYQQKTDFADNNHSEQVKSNLDQQQRISKMENTHYNSFENLEDDELFFLQNSENSNNLKNNMTMMMNCQTKNEAFQEKVITNQSIQSFSEGQTNMFKNEQIKQSIIQRVQSAIKQNPSFQYERKINSGNSNNMVMIASESNHNFNNYQQ